MQAKVFIYRPINCSLHLPPTAFKRFINQNETKTEYKFNTHTLTANYTYVTLVCFIFAELHILISFRTQK